MIKTLTCSILIASSYFILLQPKVSGNSFATKEACEQISSQLVVSVIDRMKNLPNISAINLDCKSISKLNIVKDDSVMFATTRKRGKEYICLHASGNSRPCQVKLGIVASHENPNNVLCELMQQECSNVSEGPLTETVERLYLRPSSLIR